MGAYHSRYLAAATAARLADAMWVGVVLFVLARTRDPALAGGTLAAATLPTMLSAPLLGAWLDTTGHRRAALAVNQVLLAGCVLGLLALVGRAPAAAVLGCAALAGITQPLVTGGFSSLVPSLVPAARVPRAWALESVTYDVAEVAGPALAGGLAALSPCCSPCSPRQGCGR
jgi:MFS family permease